MNRKEKTLIIISFIIIILISILNQYSVTSIDPKYSLFFYKQILFYVVSIIIYFIIKKFKIKILFNYSAVLYIISNLLLILVLIFGSTINGSTAWFNFKILSFQPSELMKLSLIIYLSTFIKKTKVKNNYKSELLFIIKLFIIILIPSVLTFLEPDTGSIIIYIVIFILSIYFSNIRKRWLIIIFLSIIFSSVILILLYIKNPDLFVNLFGSSILYRVDRLIDYKNQNSLQLKRSLILISNTPLFKFNLDNQIITLIESPTDFIFSLTINNYGLIVSLCLIIFYIIIYYIIYFHHQYSNNLYSIFTKITILTLSFQTFYNIFMNIGLLPIIGFNLPLLSYGGSNLLCTAILLCICLKITLKPNIYNMDK